MVEFLRPRKAEKRPPDDDNVPFGVLVPVLLCELEDGRSAVGDNVGIDIRRDLLSPARGVDRDRTRAVADTASMAPAIARLGEGVTIVRQFV
jgi:hypothetical protein